MWKKGFIKFMIPLAWYFQASLSFHCWLTLSNKVRGKKKSEIRESTYIGRCSGIDIGIRRKKMTGSGQPVRYVICLGQEAAARTRRK